MIGSLSKDKLRLENIGKSEEQCKNEEPVGVLHYYFSGRDMGVEMYN
jgi:hypothetical protein